MEFDGFITFILFIVFFILPSIFKFLKRGKKAATADKTPKKPTIFGKLGEEITRYLKELEEQSKQEQKQTTIAAEEQWASLAEQDADDLAEADFGYAEAPDLPPPITRTVRQERKPKKPVVPPPVFRKKRRAAGKMPGMCVAGRQNPLQNAIIWSEILGKPVALKKDL